MPNNIIDNSISYFLSCYYQHKPSNAFDFRDLLMKNAGGFQIIFLMLVSDYEDAENVYNFCRDISGRNYTQTQKRSKFKNKILNIN